MEIPLKCECGKVQGVATGISPESGSRLVCYCDDCQAFANHLACSNPILDEYGGTDIFQMPPAHLKITRGKEFIRCLRLTPKGTYRWYTDCCKTPIGNSLSAGVPFVGLIHNFMDDTGRRDNNLGPVRAYVQTKFARGTLPAERKQGFPVWVILRGVGKLLVWKIRHMEQPSPFFYPDTTPVVNPVVLNE